MDIFNLKDELNTLSSYSKQSSNEITKFYSLIKSIGHHQFNYFTKVKKEVDKFNSEILKNALNTSLNTNFGIFCASFEDYLIKMLKNLETFQIEVIETIEKFNDMIENKNKTFIKNFKNIFNTIEEYKIKLEKSRNNYFYSAKSALKQESELVKKVEESKQYNIKKDEKNLERLEETNQLNEMLYQSEIDNYNIAIEDAEKNYHEIKKAFYVDEETKWTFISYNMTKMIKYFNDENNFHKLFCEQINEANKKVNINNDIIILSQKTDYLKQKNFRFPREIFINFTNYLREIEDSGEKEITDNSPIIIKEELLSESDNANKDKDKEEFSLLNLINPIKNKINSNNNNIFRLFIQNLLKSTKPILDDQVEDIIKLIKNKSNAKNFILELNDLYNKDIQVKCCDITNLHHLSTIILSLIKQIHDDNKLLYLQDIIIKISEKTIYLDINQDNREYLCKIIANNKLFSKKYWVNLIKEKTTSVLENDKDIVTKEIQENKNKEKIIIEVIEEYIQHFSNFGYDVSDSIEIIMAQSSLLQFDINIVNFFIAQLNSNMFSITNQNKINLVKYEKFNYEQNYFNSENLKEMTKFKIINGSETNYNILILISHSLKYLTIKEFPNLLTLSKYFTSKLQKIIYENVLFKYHNIPFDTRIKIWSAALKLNNIKQKYNYKDITQKVKENNSSDIILLDINRTKLFKDSESDREKLINILMGISVLNPEISYYQGMNFVALFILNMTNDEETSFYLFASLLLESDYGSLFINNFENLRKYFYIFERLLFLLMPEFYMYLKKNAISVNFFISPWFITLFTNTFVNLNDKKNPIVLLTIWDRFIFGGWYSIIRVGLSMLKFFEVKMLSLTIEQLLQFLINDITKTEFFQNSNIDNFMNLYSYMKIDQGLINNIENEYNLKNKLNISDISNNELAFKEK